MGTWSASSRTRSGCRGGLGAAIEALFVADLGELPLERFVVALQLAELESRAEVFPQLGLLAGGMDVDPSTKVRWRMLP